MYCLHIWRFIRPFLLSERGRAQNDGSFHAALKGHLQRQICMQIFPRSALRVVMQPASRSYSHSAKIRIDLDKSWMKFCKMFDRFQYYASLIFCFITFSKSFSVPVYDNGTPMGTPRHLCMTMLINCLTFGFFFSVVEGGCCGAGGSFAVGEDGDVCRPFASGSGFGTGISGDGEENSPLTFQSMFPRHPKI